MSAMIGGVAVVRAPPRAGGRRRAALALGRRLAELGVSLLYLAAWTGTNRLAALFGGGRARLVILYYHAVPAAARARFARQLDAIAAGAAAVVPADHCAAARPGQLLVAITFDDAYTSVLDNALPELARRRMPATIFTPSGVLGRAPSWQMEAGDADRFETVADGAALCALPGDLVTIGAHTVSHPHLPAIGRDAAAAEIGESKATLARLLGREVRVFAFPYGEYDEAAVELCRRAEYRFAYHTLPRMTDPKDAAFLRGRVRADLSDWTLEFWLKMRGGYAWKAWARQLRGRLRRAGGG